MNAVKGWITSEGIFILVPSSKKLESNHCPSSSNVKFMFSKKATKIDEIFTVDLTDTTYCQIDGEDFVNFCGLLRKRTKALSLNYLLYIGR